MELNPRDLLQEEDEADRQHLKEKVARELRLQHPLSYDTLRFNPCECGRENKLSQFNVPMLKQILHHFKVPFKLRDRKRHLIKQLTFLQECDCFNFH